MTRPIGRADHRPSNTARGSHDDQGSTPLDQSEIRLSERLKSKALELGLAIYPNGGTIDGRLGDHVIIAPPYNATDDDIDRIVTRLGDAVDATVAGL